MYQTDKGWQNANLDKHGQYAGRQLDAQIVSVEAGDKFSY